jgi:hypothetical protein
MAETVKKPMVTKSILTNSFFYFTRHRKVNDRAIEIVGHKTDVTESVTHLVEQEILLFLDYVKEKYDLDLRVPKAAVGEDGQKYIHGVKEATGYEYLNELVAEYREKS